MTLMIYLQIKVWGKIGGEYPLLSGKVLKVLIPFPKTYRCHSGFSKMVTMKTKARNQLNVEHDIRCALPETDQHDEYSSVCHKCSYVFFVWKIKINLDYNLDLFFKVAWEGYLLISNVEFTGDSVKMICYEIIIIIDKNIRWNVLLSACNFVR